MKPMVHIYEGDPYFTSIEKDWNRMVKERKLWEEGMEMAELKDSGERKVFETGATRDISEGKGRCDLLPLDTVIYMLDLKQSKSPQKVLGDINTFLKTTEIKYLKEAILEFCDHNEWHIITMLLELSDRKSVV